MKKIIFFSPPLDDILNIPSYNINLLATIVSKLPFCEVAVFDSILYYNKKYGPYSKKAINNPGGFLDEIIKKVEEEKPDILFMSSTLYSLPFINEFSKSYKKRNMGVVLVLGGIAASTIPEELIEKIPAIDYFVVGEAEYLITNLVCILADNSCSRPDKIIKYDKKKEISLDELPYVNYDYLNKDLPNLYIESSRGCTHFCSFCSANSVSRKYKKKSIVRVIREMVFYNSKYNTKNFVFIDNNFTADKKWLKEFCENLINENLNITWGCSSRFDALTRKDLFMMKKSGCRGIFIGLENIFLDNLNFCKKNIKQQNQNLIKDCIEIGIIPNVSLITGFPHDTASKINQIFDYAKTLYDLGAQYHLSTLTVLPGSFLYKKFKEGDIRVFLKKKNINENEIINLFSLRYKNTMNFAPHRYLVKNSNMSNKSLEEVINNGMMNLPNKMKDGLTNSFSDKITIDNTPRDFLVIAPSKAKTDYGNEYFPLYFATILQKNGINAFYFNEVYFPGNKINHGTEESYLSFYCQTLKNLRVKVVFIYTTVFNFACVLEIIEKLRNNDEQIKIILFGEAVLHLEDRIVDKLIYADLIFDSFREEDIEKLVFILKEGQIKRQSVYSKIFNKETKEKSFNSNLFADYGIMLNLTKGKNMAIEANKGCGHNCRFCTRHYKRIYLKDPRLLVDYIRRLKQEFYAEDFSFVDNSISVDGQWLENFCNLLIKENLSVRWKALSRIDTIDNRLLKLMKKAGCSLLSYGVESLNENTLKFLGKAKDMKDYTQKALKNIYLTLENNISTHVSLITGIPSETEKDIENTSNLAKDLRGSGAVVKVELLFAVPGTSLWHDFKRGTIHLIKIKSEKLKNWVRDTNCSPPLFYDKYVDYPEITPFNWRIKNENMPDDYFEELIYENFCSFAPNKWQDKYLFKRVNGFNGKFDIIEEVNFPIKQMQVLAAPRSIRNQGEGIDCGVYINNSMVKRFKIKNNLDFSKVKVEFDKILKPDKYNILLKTQSRDDNLFVHFVDFIG